MKFTLPKLTKPKFTKPTKTQVKKFLIYCLIVLGGNALAAAGTAFFIEPNGLVMGGTTGVGIFVRNLLNKVSSADETLTSWIVNITVYTANIILFVIGAVLLGKKFAASTLAGTLLYPSFMSLYKLISGGKPIVTDTVLAVLFGALIFGLGVAMVVRVGASTGGTDIPPLILHKFFNLPVSVTMWCLDASIVLLELFVVDDIGLVFYGIIICLISSFAIEKLSPIGMKKTQVKIVSKQYRAIREMILKELNRGVTVLYGQTGYLKERCHMLLTIVSNRELVKLKNKVQEIDPEAFMTISEVSEVRGRGFSSEGIRLPKELEGKDEEELAEAAANVAEAVANSAEAAANAADNPLASSEPSASPQEKE